MSHAFFFQNVFFSFQVYFFQAPLELCCFKSCLLPWVSPHHLDVSLWGGMWSLRCLADLSGELTGLHKSSVTSLQEAAIWWVSFRKMIINTVLLLYRIFWHLLACKYNPKTESINSCCCRGLTFVPPTHGHMHPGSFSTLLLDQCSLVSPESVSGIFLGMQQEFLVRAWRGTPLTTAMQESSSPPQPPEEFLQCPKGCCVICCGTLSRGDWVSSSAENLCCFWLF